MNNASVFAGSLFGGSLTGASSFAGAVNNNFLVLVGTLVATLLVGIGAFAIAYNRGSLTPYTEIQYKKPMWVPIEEGSADFIAKETTRTISNTVNDVAQSVFPTEIKIQPHTNQKIFTQLPHPIEEALRLGEFSCKESTSNKGKFVMEDISLLQLDNMIKKLRTNSEFDVGGVFYCKEQQAACLILGLGYKIEYPSGDKWSSLIRKKPSGFSEVLTLSDGGSLSEECFIQDPLFANTLEKYSVFKRLVKLSKDSIFQEKYTTFLQDIKTQNPSWADPYKDNPVDLAYLSLFAYLNKEIDQEELFITQMLASVFFETPSSAQYTVLDENNIKTHLIDNNYLSQEQANSNIPCIQEIEQRTLIQRTSISYDYSIDGFPGDFQLKNGFLQLKVRTIGCQHTSITIAPPNLIKRLYKETSSLEVAPPTEHKEYFGYRRKFSDLFKGRPISYPSILFFLPKVHNIHFSQAGITAHDLLFHCSIDWCNPYVTVFIETARELLCQKKIEERNKKTVDAHKRIITNLLDRAILPKINLENVLEDLTNPTTDLTDSDQQKTMFKIYKYCFPKHFIREFSRFGNNIERTLGD